MRLFQRPIRRAATLFEILIGMAIFSFLVAVAFPSLSGGRSEMERVHCLNTLHEIMRLSTLYSFDDPHSILGPVPPKAFNYIFEGYASYGGGPGTMDYMDWGEDFDPRTRPFNRYIYMSYRGFKPNVEDRFAPGLSANTDPGNFGVFREFLCAGNDLGWQEWPGFGSDFRETETPYFKSNGTSYRLNNLQYDGSFPGVNQFNSPVTVENAGVYAKSATRIPNPSATVAYHEARAFETIFTNDTFGFIYQGELEGYHKRRAYFNVAFADGGAATKNFGNGTFYIPNPFLNEFDVRGTWGRFDTLQLASVPTLPPP
ncbi:hypothetical protein B7486_14260 [cyanobacterium TDX16]|nr:hypothetical protein B7486_14260 [cyanobacterium TDX16]